MQNNNSSPKPCAETGCDFFGNPLTENLCSKHYRDRQQREQKQQPQVQVQAQQQAPSPIPISVPQVPTTQQTTLPIAIPTATTTTLLNSANNSLSSSPVQQAASLTPSVSPLSSSPSQQKDPSRCFSCNKRVGLLGFECRCKLTFCSNHRFADQHNCNFDYQQMQRDKLTAANQKVEAPKIHNKI